MNVKVTRNAGRPTTVESELAKWGVAVAEEIAFFQEGYDFVASGASLDKYEVVITKKNKVDLLVADYLKFSMDRGDSKGAGPGGWMPHEVSIRWVKQKGITPPKGMTIEQFAYAISVKNYNEGNAVFRGERPGIPMEEILEGSFDIIADEMALAIAEEASLFIHQGLKTK